MSYADLRTRVQSLIKDNAHRLTRYDDEIGAGPDTYGDDADTALAIQEAVIVYSKIRPLRKMVDLTGTNVRIYALPVDWKLDFSRIEGRIESPVNESTYPQFLGRDEWEIYDTIVGGSRAQKLRFAEGLATDVVARYKYTTYHIVSDSGFTLADPRDVMPVAYKAAELCCRKLARFYAQTTDSAWTDADFVDYGPKATGYTALADTLMASYENFISITEGEQSPAIATIPIRTTLSTRGLEDEGLMTHR